MIKINTDIVFILNEKNKKKKAVNNIKDFYKALNLSIDGIFKIEIWKNLDLIKTFSFNKANYKKDNAFIKVISYSICI